MAAQAATSNRPVSHRLSPAAVRLLHALSITTAVMLLLLALWLVARRLGGQLQQPLSAPILAVVAVTLSSLAAWLRIVWHYTGLRLTPWNWRTTLAWLFPLFVVLLLALALSIAGTGTARLLLFWSILVAAEGAWWWFAWRQWRATIRQPGPPVSPASAAGPRASSSAQLSVARERDVELDESLEGGDEQLPAEVSQQITRTFAESDKDTVTGVLRARLAPHERSQSLHVAFCPPMPRPPKVTVVQLSGSRARIKAADTQPFGIRFDLRLANASEREQEVLIHFEAQCAEPDSAGLGGFGL